MITCEYIWLDNNQNFRSKTKVYTYKHEIQHAKFLDFLPEWNYDGSSTGQASGKDSEVIIKPCEVFLCPFRKERDSLLVLCDTYTPDDLPLENNYRPWAYNTFNKKLDEEPWFGIEQEYFMIDPQTNKPLGFDPNNSQGQYYCSVGTLNNFGRHIADEHLEACLYAGIKISGINAEVAPGQWEYQIGPCNGIESGDHLLVSRYILQRIAEKHNVVINFEPKPVKGDWNGSGCHTNYSTKKMREGFGDKTGLEYINDAIKLLSKNHEKHMKVYGENNDQRMTGEHETADYNKFTWGTANRGASVRIGNNNVKKEKGYFEDRRPASNMNPYLVTATLFETTVL